MPWSHPPAKEKCYPRPCFYIPVLSPDCATDSQRGLKSNDFKILRGERRVSIKQSSSEVLVSKTPDISFKPGIHNHTEVVLLELEW